MLNFSPSSSSPSPPFILSALILSITFVFYIFLCVFPSNLDEEKQSSDSVSPVARPVTTTTSSTDNIKDEASQTHSYSANKRLSPVPVLTSSPTSTVQCNGREDPPTGGPPDARPTDTNSENNNKRNRPFVSNGDPQQEGGVFLMEDESLSESPIDTG